MNAKINRNPTDRDLRNFGWVVLVGFGLIGWRLHWIGRQQGAFITWGVSGGVALLALLLPKAAKPFYWLWMGFGVAMGAVTSRIVMSIIFYGVITPVALIHRLRGRDALARRKSAVDSYWRPLAKIEDKTYYDHLF